MAELSPMMKQYFEIKQNYQAFFIIKNKNKRGNLGVSYQNTLPL